MPDRDFDSDLRRYRARTALVVGANGGIGGAVVTALDTLDRADAIVATTRQPMSHASERVRLAPLDLTNEQSISSVAATLDRTSGLDLVLVATGVLRIDERSMPEKRLAHIDRDNLAQSFAINTIGPALVAKHVLPRLARDRKSVFAVLTARVGSIGDNRKGGWYSYRASKAALNMIVKTAAIELARISLSRHACPTSSCSHQTMPR
jgi:NAD(P)-dependent dehydrogenase (short-subunit alcohol dehydrogenase family)